MFFENLEPNQFLKYILGHIGMVVPDVEKACERFEELGVQFVKKPNAGEFTESKCLYTRNE